MNELKDHNFTIKKIYIYNIFLGDHTLSWLMMSLCNVDMYLYIYPLTIKRYIFATKI